MVSSQLNTSFTRIITYTLYNRMQETQTLHHQDHVSKIWEFYWICLMCAFLINRIFVYKKKSVCSFACVLFLCYNVMVVYDSCGCQSNTVKYILFSVVIIFVSCMQHIFKRICLLSVCLFIIIGMCYNKLPNIGFEVWRLLRVLFCRWTNWTK